MKYIENVGMLLLGNALVYWLIISEQLEISKNENSVLTMCILLGVGFTLSVIGCVGAKIQDE